MSSLRSALDELRIRDLGSVPDGALVSDLDEVEHTARALEAHRASLLAEIERRGLFSADGHISLAAWLADRHRTSHAAAASQVRLARVAEQMPRVTEALAQGEVSSPAVAVLAHAQEVSPEAFARAEGPLLDAARTQPVAELRRTVDAWRMSADPDGAEAEEEARFARRAFYLSPGIDGMLRPGGALDPECGQSLITALRAVMDTDVRGGKDLRTPAQRRADALGAICRAYLDSSDRPSVGGERPHAVVLVDVDTLERRAPGRCELPDAGPIGPETARRLACDAQISRIITGPDSVPLDLGRRTRVVPAALRRALVVRDRRCRFPNCDRPPAWCDAHHVRHWGPMEAPPRCTT